MKTESQMHFLMVGINSFTSFFFMLLCYFEHVCLCSASSICCCAVHTGFVCYFSRLSSSIFVKMFFTLFFFFVFLLVFQSVLLCIDYIFSCILSIVNAKQLFSVFNYLPRKCLMQFCNTASLFTFYFPSLAVAALFFHLLYSSWLCFISVYLAFIKLQWTFSSLFLSFEQRGEKKKDSANVKKRK